MEENTDEMLQQKLQDDAHQSFLRKRQGLSGTPNEVKSEHRERKPLSEIASNAVMRNGLSSVPGRAQGATVLPQHGAEAEKNGSTRSTRFHEGFEDGREPGRYAISIDRKDTGIQWMMMCLTRHDGLADLHQLDFDTRPANNPQFFARLKREYEAKRSQPFPRLGWLSPLRQKVTKVHFVQFQTTFPRLKAGVQIVEVIANPSLPSEDEQGWTCTLRRGTSRAPLPAETMAIGLYGDNSAYEDADVYDWVPRKVHEALPAEPDLDAWGLYFVDEVSWKVMSTIVCVLLLWPLTIGIRTAISWALVKFFGFAVSGNMLMVAQLLVAIMAVSSCKLPR